MAMKTSFKQQCPSCETMVPIRDSGLIGRKIDCPKCKYRFVVDEPADDSAAEETPSKNGKKAGAITTGKGKPGPKAAGAAGAAEGKEKGDKKKKKSEGNSTMKLGIALAVVAVALLGAGLYFFVFSGDGEKKDAKGKGGKDKQQVQDTKKDGDTKEGEGKEAAEGTVSGVDITNLLPGDSQVVALVNVEKTKETSGFVLSGLNAATFDTPGAFDPKAFEHSFGFLPDKVKQLALAGNVKEGWSFNVLRTVDRLPDLDRKDLTARLKLTVGKKIGDFEYYLVGTDLDNLSRALFQNLKAKRTALHVYDPHTLVLADIKPMEAFLTEKRQPEQKTKPPTPPEKAEEGQSPMGPPGGPPMGGMGAQGGPPMGFMGAQGGPPKPPGPAAGAQGGPPKLPGPSAGAQGGPPMGFGGAQGGPPMAFQGGRPGMGSPPGGGTAAEAASDSFLTIDPPMKRVFDGIEFKKQIVTVVVNRQLAPSPPAVLAEMERKLTQVFDKNNKDIQQLMQAGTVGVALKALSDDRFALSVTNEALKTETAQNEETSLGKVASEFVKLAETTLKLKIAYQGRQFGGVAGFQGGPGPGFMGFQGGPGPGFMGAIGGPPPGFMGAQGGSSPPGGFMGAQGGSSPPGGFMGAQGGPRPGFMGAIGGPSPGFMGAQGGPPPGFQGGGAGQPGQPGQGDADATSRLTVERSGKMLTVSLDVALSEHRSIVDALQKWVAQQMTVLRSEAVMASHRSYRQGLAAALGAYAQSRRQFPRGTVDRPLAPGRVLPWRPDERVAWTAELLEFIPEYASLRASIDFQKSWNEGNNRIVAGTAIPQFLAPDEPPGAYPGDSWRSSLAGANSVAATHFVGVGGVGADAANYEARDPSTAKKRGVFGYDRITRLDEITDGPANTIAVIQVPPTFKTCWLAGGGSTIRGVPETDSLEPFVCTAYKGKKGTFAIMADGKLRFIAADMKPELFQALCTIAGGEPVGDIDTIAPEVNEGTTLRPALPGELPKIGPGETAKPPNEQPKPPAEQPKPPLEQPKPTGSITPAEAAKRVGQDCTVEFQVVAVGLAPTGALQLDAANDGDVRPQSPFAAVLSPEVSQGLKAQGDLLAAAGSMFKGKTMRVTGKVTLRGKRPEILVSNVKQLELVK